MTRAPRFFVEERPREGSTIMLAEDSAHHAVHVLRVRTGDDVSLFDGRGGEFSGRVASIERLRVTVDVLEHRAIERELPLKVVLVQGISSGERMDFTIRKAVELGVAQIQPVLAVSSLARPKGERAVARHSHWQKVAIAACEQCGRNRVPAVLSIVNATEYRAQGDALMILLSPDSETPFSRIVQQKSSAVTLAAGPEAGFNAQEERAFLDAGFVPAKLGPRVLRTETAALAAIAALSALRGDF